MPKTWTPDQVGGDKIKEDVPFVVMPANAGIHGHRKPWTPDQVGGDKIRGRSVASVWKLIR
ncbi:hypothetical protein B9Z37_03680 [Limnohabitans parvus II-B4]|uniref:Uncharacterized protein n=1 Tax=Limnohabitans parvus II-B4 TaxID=1293052 RepID=A0A315EGC6_9BURK|nr:hypothetical protein B9Z37_03680 [Limnohabitans parvus II-B4]